MKEIVIISGKGGTGKTSITGSFAALAKSAVFADCDVDAADLHLILSPEIQQEHDFISGHEAIIRQENCGRCGACKTVCRFDAVHVVMNGRTGEVDYEIDPLSCEGCGVCVRMCPAGAIDFPESHCGHWYISDTRFGPMVHARLGIAAENSGKLVSRVRKEARKIAEDRNLKMILVDGPPGIGCPVIASMTGTDAVVVITEPSLSGCHDLERVLQLAGHFQIPVLVCVNKWDINPEMTERIEKLATENKAELLGRIPFDRAVTDAQVAGISVVENGNGEAAQSVREVWEQLCRKVL